MKLPIYQIDAFAEEAFTGNPAAIVPLDGWLEDQTMQSIAEENNLSETAFIVATDNGYHIRWFTPSCEVDLCGHATLAAAYVAIQFLQETRNPICFDSKSGKLFVSHKIDVNKKTILTLDFPVAEYEEIETPQALILGLGKAPIKTYAAADYLAIFSSEEDILQLTPNFSQLQELDRRGVIVSAPGKEADFVSRFFAPNAGIAEDPVTGSAHCLLTPYWANRLDRTELTAIQRSARGGALTCALQGNRVLISGHATLYLQGGIYI
ncbi:isomerase [Gammaproteobacteria bacterium 42_54_T18]|nr:isomerase [Gammaproteobacteria bacterium 42_54_T18]